MSMAKRKKKLVVTEISRQDLLKMSELSNWLDESDVIFVTSRDKLDTVMVRPSKLLELLSKPASTESLVNIINQRLEADESSELNGRDVDVLQVLVKYPNIRLTELAGHLNLQPSNLHRRLQELVDEALVIRTEDQDITYAASAIGTAAVEAVSLQSQ